MDFKKSCAREKRGGGKVVLFDQLVAEKRIAADLTSPAEEIFDRAWALEVLDAAVARLEQSYASTERAGQFAALRPFFTDDADYDAFCAKLSLTPAAARQAVHRLRERLGRALRDEIAGTLFEPTEATVDEELAALKSALAQ